jgi:hypothetical protein
MATRIWIPTLLSFALISGSAQAEFIHMSLATSDFNDLLGGAAIAVDDPLVSDISLGNVHADLTSQAFTDGLGNYAYLYQLENTGSPANDVLEVLTISPMIGVTSDTVLGHLTANPPTGFSLGDQLPAGATLNTATGPTLSFGFPGPYFEGFPSCALESGMTSNVLYVLVSAPPTLATANLVHPASAVAPAPEPATVFLLAGGGLCWLAWTCLRRRP